MTSPPGAGPVDPTRELADVELGMGHRVDLQREVADRITPHVVEFHNVTKVFYPDTSKAFTAIRDVSFAVEDLPDKGEFACILGPSGCGKSTILKLIAGLPPHHPQTSGEILVQNHRIAGPGPDRGMVFQEYTSFDNRTVLENVCFGLECLGVDRRQREDLGREWIQRVGLSVKHDQRKYPHELSGGMRQRVAIARTLILNPRIILMDEPFGALDPHTRLSMQDLLVSLWNRVEATVFFVTHSIEEAVFLGDRIYLMTNSPGTIHEELRIELSDRPAQEMHRDAKFQETVYYISDFITRLELQPADR